MPLNDLYKEFPRGSIHWRAGAMTKDKTKAMALAYLDARDVMERLDDVVGPENWQDSYQETPTGRVICTLSIKCGDFWIDKADGSGSSDIEGEKGGISGAFKRAAVKWGVGRYLYDMPSPWVPCETFNGKWQKWSADPWSYVRNAPAPHVPAGGELNADMPDAQELSPGDVPDVNSEQNMVAAMAGAESVQAAVEAVARWFRVRGEGRGSQAFVDAFKSTAARLSIDPEVLKTKARAFNAAEYPKDTAA